MWRLAMLLMIPSVACSSLKIVNGQDADIEDRPYQVGLHMGFSLCGGSIVDKRVVLTAAHCVEWGSGNVTVHAGSPLMLNGSVTAKVVNVVIHPRHDALRFKYDAALLQIDRDFVYDEKIQPVTLATREPSPGDEVTASGWGKLKEGGNSSEVLQQVTMSTIDRRTCDEMLRAPPGYVSKDRFCTFTAGKSPCHGDSGGPLTDGSGHLVGIMSAVGYNHCGSDKYPCLYASVPAIRDWVQDTVRSLTASTAKYMLPLIPI